MTRRYVTQEQIDFYKAKLKGWDWTEVLEVLEVETSDHDEVNMMRIQKLLDATIAELWNIQGMTKWFGELGQKHVEVLAACRAHAEVLGEMDDYYSPLWAGLGKIEHELQFMMMFRQLYQNMWT